MNNELKEHCSYMVIDEEIKRVGESIERLSRDINEAMKKILEGGHCIEIDSLKEMDERRDQLYSVVSVLCDLKDKIGKRERLEELIGEKIKQLNYLRTKNEVGWNGCNIKDHILEVLKREPLSKSYWEYSSLGGGAHSLKEEILLAIKSLLLEVSEHHLFDVKTDIYLGLKNGAYLLEYDVNEFFSENLHSVDLMKEIMKKTSTWISDSCLNSGSIDDLKKTLYKEFFLAMKAQDYFDAELVSFLMLAFDQDYGHIVGSGPVVKYSKAEKLYEEMSHRVVKKKLSNPEEVVESYRRKPYFIYTLRREDGELIKAGGVEGNPNFPLHTFLGS